MSSSRSATVFTASTLGVFVFQLALVGGAPWGALTQGGRVIGTLLPGGRVFAAVSALLLLVFVAIVRVRARRQSRRVLHNAACSVQSAVSGQEFLRASRFLILATAGAAGAGAKSST